MADIDSIVSFWLRQPFLKRFKEKGETQYKSLVFFLKSSGCAKNSKGIKETESVQGKD